jgi:polysaccharide export outer membrane protein
MKNLLKTKKVRNLKSTIVCLFGLLTMHAQTEQDIASEANRLDISSRQEAITALSNRGISEAQAKQMAQIRGIDFEAFLQDYLNAKESNSEAVSKKTANTEVATELEVVPLDSVAPVLREPSEVMPETKAFFGYAIFENNPFGQKEYLVGNIDEGYILAPGDELRLTVFGDNNLELVAKIDLNGNISVPNIGVFFAAGSSFATLKERLKLFLGKYYSGLLAYPTRTFLDVSLTQIRPVKVSVLGNVNTPGPHLVSGMATVLNALYASGGIRTSGTLRDVKVYRNNKLIKSIDLYDYITQGNIDQDIRLSNNDIVFVGPRGSSVVLEGAVKTSATYELKAKESLKDLFAFSGGLPASASIKNINVARITPFEARTQQLVYDRFLTTVDYARLQKSPREAFPLEDGDLVTVQPILEKQKNEVFVVGNVNAPGRYALDVFQDLKTLIHTGAKGLLPNTYLQKLDLQRVDADGNPSFKTYDLSSVLNGEVQVSLQENDTVRIYALEEVEGIKTVQISGFGTAPKTVFWSQNLSIFDLIFQAVSFEELDFQAAVLASRLDLKSFDEVTGLYDLTQYSLDDLETLKSTFLSPKDEVVLYTKAVTQALEPTFQILGPVVNPGEYPLGKGLYVEDAILMAEGFLERADKTTVHINRLDRSVQNGTYSKMVIHALDMDYLLGLKESPAVPYVLQNHDVITTFAPIRALQVPVVSVRGEVKFPQNVVLEKDAISIKNLVEFVGGFTKQANLESSYVLRDSLKMYIDLKKNYAKASNTLQDKDILVIGSNLASVKTSGAVQNPTIFNWEKGKRAKYYLNQSGGTKKRIESRVVLQANGRTQKIGFLKNPKIHPGAEILVVEKPAKVAGERGKFMDDFVRIFGLVASALSTVVLASQL